MSEMLNYTQVCYSQLAYGFKSTLEKLLVLLVQNILKYTGSDGIPKLV